MTTIQPRRANSKDGGFISRSLIYLLIFVLSIAVLLGISKSNVTAASSVIKSGIKGFCLDDYRDKQTANNKVVLWSCDNSSAQSWADDSGKITHNSDCLSVQNDDTVKGSGVIMDACSDKPGQVWLKYGKGYYNPNSGQCLTAAGANQQIIILGCNTPLTPNQIWVGDDSSNKLNGPSNCAGREGQAVACYAEKQWALWQSGTVSHEHLLNQYTDGAPYEEWCADFVSYVYREAQHPFTMAYDGWDENNANAIQNYGFNLHLASSGYQPKPGDIAYFDYNGGHVEIVVSGGIKPTFIYGDSAAIDTATGNGQMKANTITNDGPEGNLIYYLTPR